MSYEPVKSDVQLDGKIIAPTRQQAPELGNQGFYGSNGVTITAISDLVQSLNNESYFCSSDAHRYVAPI
ncbi:hypothetical protein LWI29_005535 [Acer saccharum]|uniref:Uncharacterized protein n=1 Tax=Acer saccharum TaxID=4024 RepID=A0AA39RGZ4_ACESA|nr:hypothetical protein LWI29_005535 [Acer saccharum]